MRSILLVSLILLSLTCRGQFSWRKSFFGASHIYSESHDRNDSGEIFCLSTISVGPLGGSDLLLTKHTAQGSIIWSRALGDGQFQDGANGIVRVLENNEIFVAGYSKLTANSNRDLFMSKLDAANGDVIWSSTILGLNDHDSPRDVIQLQSGNILMVGSTNSDTFGSSDGLILEMNPIGELVYAYHIGGSSNDHLYSVEQLDNGVILAAGNCQSFDGTHHGWLVGFNEQGVIDFQKLVSSNNFEYFMNLVVGTDSQWYLSGFSNDQGQDASWIMSLSPEFELNWSKLIGGNGENEATSMIIGDNSISVLSNTTAYNVISNEELLVSRFQLDGNEIDHTVVANNQNLESQIVTGGMSQFNDQLSLFGTASTSPNSIQLISLNPDEMSEECNLASVNPQVFSTNPIIINTDYGQSFVSGYVMTDATSVDYEMNDQVICQSECDLTFDINVDLATCPGQTNLIHSNVSSPAVSTWIWEGESYQGDSLMLVSGDPFFLELSISNETCSLDTSFWLEPNILSPPDSTTLTSSFCPGQIESVDLPSQWTGIEELFNPFFLTADTLIYYEIPWECGQETIQVNYLLEPLLIDTSFSIQLCNQNTLNLNELDLGPYNDFGNSIIEDIESDSALVLIHEGICNSSELTIEIQSVDINIDSFQSMSDICEIDSVHIFLSENSIMTLNGVVLEQDTIIVQTGHHELINNHQSGCEITQTFFIPELDSELCNPCEDFEFYIPNAFTPNGDGINENFGVTLNCEPDLFEFNIYDRWGERIFATKNPETKWNGDVNKGGYFAIDGIYVWIVKLGFGSNLTSQSGHVILLR